MRTLAQSSLIALALAGAPLAAQDAPPGGFRLPTPTPTPTDIQGPVDPDAPILTRPRDTSPTPTPTPRATPTPTPTPRPVPTPTPRPVPPPSNSSLPPRFTPPATPTPEQSAAAVDTSGAFPTSPDATVPAPLPAPEAAESFPAATAAPQESEQEGLPTWLLVLGGLLAVAGAGAAALAWRRKREAEAAAPEIVPPIAAPVPTAAEPPLSFTGPQLLIEARAIRLSRSMVYATLSYEVQVTNRGGQPLEGVKLGADLVTAHARIPTDQQLADPLVPLAPVESFDRLDPGQSVQVLGELRLPVSQIRPIPHGKAVVYVPLLRVRAEAQGMIPVARTFVVGMRPAGASERLQPFRLDEMPQTYTPLSQLALD
jgi:hypothetical protein